MSAEAKSGTKSEKLTNEKHDVVIIDDDPDVLARISDEMDVFCVEGNGADYKVQSEAGAGRLIF